MTCLFSVKFFDTNFWSGKFKCANVTVCGIYLRKNKNIHFISPNDCHEFVRPSLKVLAALFNFVTVVSKERSALYSTT